MLPELWFSIGLVSAEIFDKIPDLESFISPDTNMALIYISGYITRKDNELSENELLEKTTFQQQKYGQYTDSTDHGGFNIPTDNTCQWVIFSFIIFNIIKGLVCRTSLSNILMMVSEFYKFEMQRHHRNIVSNIYLNNLCKLLTPHSNKEPAQKVLKLS